VKIICLRIDVQLGCLRNQSHEVSSTKIMRTLLRAVLVSSLLSLLCIPVISQDNTSILVQATLTENGSIPFHMKATITEGREQDEVGHVELFWLAPDKWRRTIEADEFSQTLIVNGDQVYEQDSDDYFPVGIRVLVTSMTDPQPVLAAHKSEDILLTKANGASDESGRTCYGGNFHLCGNSRFGLMEEVGTPGYKLSFTDYRSFGDKRVARLINFTVGVGEFLTLHVGELSKLKASEKDLFSVPSPTIKQERIASVLLSETDLRALGVSTPDIIWPQVLDGATTGTAGFYISVDKTGKVREVLPVHTDNERSNDSARRQIMQWKFKPAIQNGVPVQAEGILNFTLNTRAWGPAEPLSDAEARELASNRVEPLVPPGVENGASKTIWVAVDSDGQVIEEIAAEGSPELTIPCMDALKKWQFKPMMENGQPRPYRAKIVFVVR
jgi:Gram-negative bacterial TonB protein C-terminal